MNDEIQAAISMLRQNMHRDDFSVIQIDVVSELEKLPNASDAVEPILRLIEENGEVDFGMPGYLVHFVEQFYRAGYQEKLVESIQRAPTTHNLWMLNRLVNVASSVERKLLLHELDQVIQRPDISELVRSEASHFRSLHRGTH